MLICCCLLLHENILLPHFYSKSSTKYYSKQSTTQYNVFMVCDKRDIATSKWVNESIGGRHLLQHYHMTMKNLTFLVIALWYSEMREIYVCVLCCLRMCDTTHMEYDWPSQYGTCFATINLNNPLPINSPGKRCT